MATSAILKQKALSYVQSIGAMKDKERSRPPTKTLADDYNRLRQMVEEVHPELKDVLPPLLTFYEDWGGQPAVNESHTDICNFCQQFVNLLP